MTFEEFSKIIKSMLSDYLCEVTDQSSGPYKTFEVEIEQGSLGPMKVIYNNDEEILLNMKGSVETAYAYECLDTLEETCKDVKKVIKKLETFIK